MDRGKGPFFLPDTYALFTSTVHLLLHLQYNRRFEPMILKMRVKSKFVLWKPRHYDLFTEKKKIRKFIFLKNAFFSKRTVTVDLKKFSLNTNFRWHTFEEFRVVKFNYFSERLNKVKETFWNIFDRPLCWWWWK